MCEWHSGPGKFGEPGSLGGGDKTALSFLSRDPYWWELLLPPGVAGVALSHSRTIFSRRAQIEKESRRCLLRIRVEGWRRHWRIDTESLCGLCGLLY